MTAVTAGERSTRHVVVVGGGISGLSAAWRLRREGPPDLRVTVLEGSSRVGGSLRVAEVGGVPVDVGAEAMLFRRPEAVALAHELGLGDDVVHPVTTSARLWSRGRLVPMPRTLMGVPSDVRDLDQVLSPRGLSRAAMDAVLPASDLDGRDVSVGALVEERLGAEVVDRLVEPLLGGVYAGHARELSARAAVPQLVALLSRHRSLSRAVAQTLPAPGTGPPVFAGIRGGVGRIPATLARLLVEDGVEVRTGATVRDLAHRPGGGWRLVVGSAAEPELLAADGVVLATPARSTARLLSDVTPAAALTLGRVETASVVVVTLAVPAPGMPTVPGSPSSGFLVPPIEKRDVKAATLSFAKWDWVRERGRGLLLLRCSMGRHRDERALQRTDEELVRLAVSDLSAALGSPVRPVATHVQRWGGALPQYAVGHLDRVADVRRDVARHPALAVCGATYDGVGVPACVASADLAARSVLGDLASDAS